MVNVVIKSWTEMKTIIVIIEILVYKERPYNIGAHVIQMGRHRVHPAPEIHVLGKEYTNSQ